MSLSRSLSATVLVFFSLAALGDGTLTMNGKTVKLNHAYATTRKNSFDKKKTDVLVLFTDRELPADVLKDDFGIMEASSKTPFNGVSAQFDSDKQVTSGQVFSQNMNKKGMDQFSSVGTQKVELTTMTPSRVAGKLFMPKEDDFFENKYQYSINFDVPIVTAAAMKANEPAPKGKPLPADGGDPRKAYDDYRKAFASGDLAKLRNAIVPEHAAQMDDPDFKKMFPLMQQLQPKNVKYLNGTIDGDTATLNLSSKDKTETSTGTVTMVKQGGKWKVDKESWKSTSE